MRLSCTAAALAVLLCGNVETDMPSSLAAWSETSVDVGLAVSAEKQAEALRNTLINGLRAAREDQKNFINHIVKMVAEDKLPQALVYASFRWARKQRPDYPFPYFKYAVRELAKRKGINI